MRKFLVCLLSTAALTSMTGCHRMGSGSAPSGQVVAKVGGDEITQRELSAELNGFSSSDPDTMKNAQQAALDAIVNRKLLDKAARDSGVEKSADYQLLRQRADDTMLAQAYEQQIASKLPRPTPEEVNAYISQHPNTFAQRKLYLVDQIRLPKDADPKVLVKLKPLHSMDEIEQVLLGAGLDYVREPSSLDARGLPPNVIDQIARVPQNEPFVLPSDNAITINQITQVRTIPFTGPAAAELAERSLFNERASKAVAERIAQLRKASGTVEYQQGYGPAKSSGSR